MSRNDLPVPNLTLSNQEARRFMLAHHGLWPPRKLKGKPGILKLFDRLGCIQYDTINIVGRNADLVLQSRVTSYRPTILEELLYQDRKLIDGWDKVACIYRTEDWPYFARQRAAMPVFHAERSKDAMELAPQLLEAIRARGPLSSIDFKDDKKTDWFWAPTSLSRASLEILYAWGKLGVHHKVNTRRVFDLIERLVPTKILDQEDPNQSDQDYHDWHILRRIGSKGLAASNSGEHWYGIHGAKTPERKAALRRLVEQERVIPLSVEGIDNQTLFMRTNDLDTLNAVMGQRAPKSQAAFIAPLDNLIWNRKFTKLLFNFTYAWEVYKPKAKREYGYYVLPVLYGDRFIGRVDQAFDKKTRVLTITNWWWEEGVVPDDAMLKAIARCIREFGRYLEVSSIEINPSSGLSIQL
jgi:uncharacterized protein YcaQ